MVGVVDLVGVDVVLELFQKTQQVEANGGMMIKNGARRRTPGGVFLHLLREMNDDSRVDPKQVKQFFAQSQRNDLHQEHKKHFRRGSPHEQVGRGYQRERKTHPYKNSYGSYQRRKHSSGECHDKDNFQSELEALRKLSQKVKTKREKSKSSSNKLEEAVEMEPVDNETGQEIENRVEGVEEEEEELKPLPDILSCISRQMADSVHERRSSNDSDDRPVSTEALRSDSPAVSPSSSGIVTEHDLLASCQASTSSASGPAKANRGNLPSHLDIFVEPEAPPNSVERPISTYEDDLLADFSTEDIELF